MRRLPPRTRPTRRTGRRPDFARPKGCSDDPACCTDRPRHRISGRSDYQGPPHMYLLSKEGNRHLLEFLRNLTPQVLLLSSALLLFVFWRKNPDAYLYLVLFAGISAMCIVAGIANINNFMDNAFSHSAVIAVERDRLKSESIDGYARIGRILRFIWKEKPGTLVELSVALLFVYGALIAILVASVITAMRAIG